VRSKNIEIVLLTDTSLAPRHERVASCYQFFNPIYNYQPSESPKKWWLLGTHLSILGLSVDNPEQGKRLAPKRY
jgi:hypothetical protein